MTQPSNLRQYWFDGSIKTPCAVLAHPLAMRSLVEGDEQPEWPIVKHAWNVAMHVLNNIFGML